MIINLTNAEMELAEAIRQKIALRWLDSCQFQDCQTQRQSQTLYSETCQKYLQLSLRGSQAKR